MTEPNVLYAVRVSEGLIFNQTPLGFLRERIVLGQDSGERVAVYKLEKHVKITQSAEVIDLPEEPQE